MDTRKKSLSETVKVFKLTATIKPSMKRRDVGLSSTNLNFDYVTDDRHSLSQPTEQHPPPADIITSTIKPANMDIPSDPIPQNFDAANAPNLPEIEKQLSLYQYYLRCIEQAETYWNLLGAIPPSKMRLTKLDEEILSEFKLAFPEMAENKDGKLQKINESDLKSPEGKEAWRKYIKLFETTVSDYNFGTLIRTNSMEDYTEKNTMFITRIQFYAIEICRNRLGLNDHAHQLAKKEWLAKQSK
ncbi:hypothetical protein MJO28_006718 [Puccinia striiformis f. sp. tritici]|uniref:Uncharacterized protein n=1 Tax=Puccinia striiformis f. sp. tritici TaxID=168172 RepID=A0ACC0EJT2_9BASI|nr:hypothetical protein MJO28_006718 [Puccinia striiformis f. sp. tritici]